MVLDFVALSAYTVPETYTWDEGLPLTTVTNTVTSTTTQSYISGYAPALKVYFFNDSIPDLGFESTTYEWNFGDYYNDTQNIAALSCTSLIEHTYIMPGIYTVSLSLVQSRQTEELDKTGNSKLCRGKYERRWFWDEMLCGKQTELTWDDTACGGRVEKWWDDEIACFEKYCKFWSWNDLKSNSSNPVNWNETSTDSEFVKKWAFEVNDSICKVNEADFLSTLESSGRAIIRTNMIEVKELPPRAGMYCVTRPLTGISPFTVQLTPKSSKCGSFPIDRIDWDFGDGSPVKTISRYTATSGEKVIFNNAFPFDTLDVRNYDVLHTYQRKIGSYPVFYPSLTCYSANTNTSDSCSITIGPVTLSAVSTQTHLLKTRNTLKGNLYTLDLNDNISFFSTNENIKRKEIQPTTPQNRLRDTFGAPPLGYFGNNGQNFPPEYTPDCGTQAVVLPAVFLATEDSTPLTLTDMLSDEGVAILSETNLAFIP